jgi:hypothetical protein
MVSVTPCLDQSLGIMFWMPPSGGQLTLHAIKLIRFPHMLAAGQIDLDELTAAVEELSSRRSTIRSLKLVIGFMVRGCVSLTKTSHTC